MSNTNDEIHHYQRKIEKYSNDSKVLLHCLNKLTKLPIGVEHLQFTGIGRTVNGMRKMDGAVGETARILVNRWKDMVAAEDEKSSSNESSAGEEEVVQKNHNVEVPYKQSKSKKVKEKESDNFHQPSTSNRNKTPDKSHKKSSKRDKEHASARDHEDESSSSRSKSKSRRKRRRSQDDDSTVHEEEHQRDSAETDNDIEQDTSSRSFADALGSIESTSKKSKKSSKDKDRRSEKHSKSLATPSQSSSSTSPAFSPPAPTSIATLPAPIPPLPRIAEFRLPDFEISPHYKPLPSKYPMESPLVRMKTTEEALSVAMLQKGARTKVFSGNRSSGLSYVPTLFASCIRVLQSDIEGLSQNGAFTTWAPYDLLRPVLERATAAQLYNLEHHNVYLLDDTDELWKVLCQREHKKAVRQELESWRELYLRCHEERETRLKSLTNSHKESMKKKIPVRTTKLAYVDSVVRAPRGMSSKSGQTAVLTSMTNAKTGARPFESAHNTSNGVVAVAEVVKMAPPPSSRGTSSSTSSSAAAKKPKVAPLMQKTLKLMKNRFRR